MLDVTEKSCKILVISPIVLVMLPQFLVLSLVKRNLAFSFNRNNFMGLLGAVFIALWICLGAVFTTLWLNVDEIVLKSLLILSYVLFTFSIGSIGFVLLINTYIFGIVFVKKKCYGCNFRKLILDHELVHLNSDASENEVWNTLKKDYDVEETNIYREGRVCDYCPIPARLKENGV
jgi:hypothetical protein